MKSEMKTSWNRVGIFIGTKHLGLSLGYETKRLENRDETLLYETPRDLGPSQRQLSQNVERKI